MDKRTVKKMLWIALAIAVVVFVIGCSAQGQVPPPTGPIGGGCG